MTTRTVNIALTEQHPQQRRLIFTPDLASLGGSLLLEFQYETVTNDAGVGSIALPVAASGEILYSYEIPGYPGVSTGSFAIGAGSAINLDDLVAAGGTASDSTIAYVDAAIAAIPGMDDDLHVIALMDASVAGMIASDGAGWIKKTYAQVKTALGLSKSDVGLGSADNTADVDKPVSTLQAAADAAARDAAKAYADTLVVGLIDDRGNYNASGNTFPASGGSGSAGAILKGDMWTVSVAGTLGGHPVTAGDVVRALTDTPGQTDANWAITENNFGYVAENAANKNASGGYAGLTLFKINFRNAADSFTSFLTNANTAARTYTFQDKDGTIADTNDVAAAVSDAAYGSGWDGVTGVAPSKNAVYDKVNALPSETATLTNKRITKRVVTVTQHATPTLNTDNADVASITALAQAITSMTTNLSGTPVAGDDLIVEITDNGTARAIAWGASFEASTVALPTTTVVSTLLTVAFRWNTVTSKWRCVGAA